MKNILMLFILLAAVAAGNAQGVQSPAGKWKLREGWENTPANKKIDFLRDMYKKQPCLEKLVYVFTISGGTISLEENHCDDVDDDATPAFGTRWFIGGDPENPSSPKTFIVVYNDEIDRQFFEIEKKGNKMMWRAVFKDPETNQVERTIHYVFEKA